MPTVFETGATFRLEDQFSEPLRRLLGGLSDADAAVKKVAESIGGIGLSFERTAKASIGSISLLNNDVMEKAKAWKVELDNVFGSLGKSADLGANASIAALGRMDAAINASMGRIGAMAAEFEKINASAAGALAGAGMGRGHVRPGQSHGGGSPHFSRVSVPTGMGHMSFGGNAGLAALGLTGYAAYEAAEVDDVIARAMITGQLPVGQAYMQSDAAKQMRGVIQKIMTTTGYSGHDAGEALLKTERQLGGMDFKSRMDLLSTLAPLAAAESKLKEADFGESFQSMVGLMHMTGTFDPKQLPDLARAFAFSSLNTPQNLSQFERTLGYSMPVLHAGLDMDPAAVMFMTAMEQSAGISSTKAGTWTRDLFKNSMPFMGDEKDLDKKQLEHNFNLQRLGLIDSDRNITWQDKGADGKVDWMSSIIHMSKNLQDALPKIDPVERMRVLSGALGERGAGAGALMNLPQFVEQLPILAERMKSFQGGAGALSQLSNSTAQKARQSWQETMVVLQDIGEKVLPAVNTGLKDFDQIIKGLGDIVSGKGWGNLFSSFYEHAIKPDLGPLGRLGDPKESRTKDDYAGPGDGKSWWQRIGDGGLPGFGLMAFESGAGGSSPMSDAIASGFLKAFREIQGGTAGVAGMGGGSGGIISAAYTTYGSGGGAHGSGVSGNGFFASGAPSGAVDTALGLLGANETRNRGQVNAFLNTHGQHIDAARTAWCAAFVNSALESVGIHGTGSLAASSFQNWGQSVGLGNVHKGDVIVKNHHVGLATGEVDKFGRIGMVSGNHGNAVGRSWEDPRGILGLRRAMPSVGAPPRHHQPIQVTAELHVDGEKMASNVSRHMARGMEFPSGMGVDNYGSWQGPATPLPDAA